MTKNYGKNLTVGSIPKALVTFAIPIFMGNLLSSGYHIINTIWVGNLLGGRAVAAAAVSFPLVLLMVAVCAGATTASTVLVAHFFGAGDHDRIQQIVNTSWSLAGILSLLCTLAGVAGADVLLKWMNTPPEIHAQAASYLRLTFCGFVFMDISFLLMSTLRAIGDSKRPLYFVVLGTVLNAVLDPLLIAGVGPFPRLGLNGAAFASLLSAGIATVTGFVYLKIKYRHSPVYPRRLELDGVWIRKTVQIGFPQFIQQSLFSFAIAFMTALVNGFGASATAAFGIVGRIDGLVALPAMAVLAAVSTVTAQNLGARKTERVHEVFRWGLVINTPAILVMSLTVMLFPDAAMRLFVRDPEIIRIGAQYLRIMGVGYLFLIPPYVSNGIIVGSGKTMVTMLISFISLCLVRIPLAAGLSRTSLGVTGVWVAAAISFPVNAGLGYWYYLSGKWKRPAPGRGFPAAEEAALASSQME